MRNECTVRRTRDWAIAVQQDTLHTHTHTDTLTHTHNRYVNDGFTLGGNDVQDKHQIEKWKERWKMSWIMMTCDLNIWWSINESTNQPLYQLRISDQSSVVLSFCPPVSEFTEGFAVFAFVKHSELIRRSGIFWWMMVDDEIYCNIWMMMPIPRDSNTAFPRSTSFAWGCPLGASLC